MTWLQLFGEPKPLAAASSVFRADSFVEPAAVEIGIAVEQGLLIADCLRGPGCH